MNTAFRGLLRNYKFPLISGTDLKVVLLSRKHLLLNQIDTPCKFYMVVHAIMYKGEKEISTIFRHKIKLADNNEDKIVMFEQAIDELQCNLDKFTSCGSGWLIQKFDRVELNIAKL